MEITEAALQTKANDIIDAVEFITINNDSELEEANSILRKIVTLKKAAKAYFDDLKKPFNEGIANLRAKEKAFIEPMEKGERAIKNMMLEYNTKVSERIKAEQKKLEEAAKQLSASGLDIVPSVKIEAQKVAGTTTRTRYDFEIVDVNLIPREYLIPDTAAIGKVVRAMKEKTNIPGIKVKMVKDIITRGL